MTAIQLLSRGYQALPDPASSCPHHHPASSPSAHPKYPPLQATELPIYPRLSPHVTSLLTLPSILVIQPSGHTWPQVSSPSSKSPWIFFFFGTPHYSMWVLVPQPGIKPVSSGWQILNHGTTREVPPPPQFGSTLSAVVLICVAPQGN